jgi:F-type H+-transporting ATPase subunit b
MSDTFYDSLAIWSQVVASFVFIAVLIYLWQRYIRPGVIAAQARKNGELVEAERRRDASKAALEAANEELEAAHDDARKIAARAERDASALRDRLIAAARAEGRHAVQNAQGELERARIAAREQLRTEMLEKAMAIARDAAGRLDAATNGRLVEEALPAEAEA